MIQNSDLLELETYLALASPALRCVFSSSLVFPIPLQLTVLLEINKSQEATPPGYSPIFIRQELNRCQSTCRSLRQNKISSYFFFFNGPKMCPIVYTFFTHYFTQCSCLVVKIMAEKILNLLAFVRRNKDQGRIGSVSSCSWNRDT